MLIHSHNVSISIEQWQINGLAKASGPGGLRSPRRGREIYVFVCMYDCNRESLSPCVSVRECVRVCMQGCTDVCVLLHTQWDLLSGVSGEQEDQQGQTRDEHAGDEQVEAVVKCPAPHGDRERHIGVGLLTAVVVQLITLSRHTWGRNEEMGRCQLEVKYTEL